MSKIRFPMAARPYYADEVVDNSFLNKEYEKSLKLKLKAMVSSFNYGYSTKEMKSQLGNEPSPTANKKQN